MDKLLSSEINDGIKELLRQLCGLVDEDEIFKKLYKSLVAKIKKSDTLYFLNQKEVDRSIAGMSEKFSFHGFFDQAESLEKSYKKYIGKSLSKTDLMNRLNIVKFLLCLSETPTQKFLEKPEEFDVNSTDDDEEQIDWKEYLNEGTEGWAHNFGSITSDDDDSDRSCDSEDATGEVKNKPSVCMQSQPIQIQSVEKSVVVDFRANREELLNTIQHSWYNKKDYREFPRSERQEANVEISWEGFLQRESMGLVKLPKISIISEYKVIREILWQLWVPHISAVFEFDRTNIQVKNNITISSVRVIAFQSFIEKEFVPYIEVMEFFREFSKSLETPNYESISLIPITYKCYNNALKNIIRPIYMKLTELENTVHEQETTYTLLNLANDLGEILTPVCQLRNIHKEVIIDHKTNSNIVCAATLLTRLHKSLPNAESKLDHDLKLTLFLESLQHYFTIIDAWFINNDFADFSNEFPIKKENNCNNSTEDISFLDADIWKLSFDLREELPEDLAANGIIHIIRNIVLQIGRNLHFLRLLGNFTLLSETKETIHQQFVRSVLEHICQFFKLDPKHSIGIPENPNEEETNLNYKYPVIWGNGNVRPVEMDGLENLVDTSDGFLMLAFEDYFFEKPEKEKVAEPSLFERITLVTQKMFPVLDFFEVIFKNILKERFTVSGLMVKSMLIEQYHLEKQFQLLRHLFMFQDDLIFPFYRKLFERMNSKNKIWGNDIWLTSTLQDVIMDVYPDFYEKCVVQVKENWRLCSDSLVTCEMVSVQYSINWPLNIIISSVQIAVYKDIFQFILKIKWALYTLTHLCFTDLEPKMKNYHKSKPKTHRNTIAKLKYLKFVLVNLLSNIQHYIFSFGFSKYLQQFETEFEKAYDLSSMMKSHSEFINNIRLMTMDIRSAEMGVPPFDNVLKCVNSLKVMWNNLEYATPEKLNSCQKRYEESYQIINPILFPAFLFDY